MNKNQILRYFVYLIFCPLITIVGVALTYYVHTIDDTKIDWKFDSEEFLEESEDCFEMENGSFIGGLFMAICSPLVGLLADRFDFRTALLCLGIFLVMIAIGPALKVSDRISRLKKN